MNSIDEVFELIHRNGAGQDITCFFSSEDTEKDRVHMSIVHNYKYKDGQIKISVNQSNFQEQEKTLAKYPNCELLIKRDEGNGNSTKIIVFCKFLKTESQHIFVKAFSIKYTDSAGKETKHKIF